MEELFGRLQTALGSAYRVERELGGGGMSRVFLAEETRLARALERGRVNERLGNREVAIEAYALVARAWRNADPELKAYVDEARAGLARLSAEKRAS